MLTRSTTRRSHLVSARALILALSFTHATTHQLAAQSPARSSALSRPEQQMRDWIRTHAEDQIAYLGRVVDIPSGTMNHAGVRRVGDAFRASLDSLGFTTRWIAMPDGVNRAGHLFAERVGKPGTTRLLLIGHLDTVFEGPGQQFVRQDTVARGAGSTDMKGGDVVLLFALKAMHAAGTLADANIIVALTGDEESAGDPLSASRGDLIAAARRSDLALAFEGGNASDATVARRGASAWSLRVTGRQAHSAGVFGESAGYGAIYEAARILDQFRVQLAGEEYLTFNTGLILGGTDVAMDTARVAGTAASKLNIVPRTATVAGDLRFISEEQKERTRARMREIVAKSLPGTSAEITFSDEYPAMAPTPGNYRVLAVYDSVSQALGHGPVRALDPGRRGAGDISFVAPYIDGLDGLGTLGAGSHSPDERVSLTALPMQTERAALLVYRLSRQKPVAREAVAKAQGSVDIRRERERLREAEQAFVAAAASRNAAEAIAATYADDVVLLVADEPMISGRAAALAELHRSPHALKGVVRWRPMRLDVSADGTLGYSFGYSELEVPPGTDSAGKSIAGTYVGKYLSLWRRQPDGAWKVAVQVRNVRRPGEPASAPPSGFASPTGPAMVVPNASASSARDAAMAADRAFSDSAARDVGQAFAFFAAPDGALLGSGPEMVWGREAIRGAFAGSGPPRRLVWRPVLGGAAASGDMAYTVGRADVLALDQPGTPVVGHTKYLTVWQKQRDGSWRYVVDGGNAAP